MPNQIQQQRTFLQPETLAHITGQTRAEITCARAHEQRIDFRDIRSSIAQCSLRRRRCQRRSVPGKAFVQLVAVEPECIVERLQEQMSRFNAVVTQQDFANESLRSGRKGVKKFGSPFAVPAPSPCVSAGPVPPFQCPQ